MCYIPVQVSHHVTVDCVFVCNLFIHKHISIYSKHVPVYLSWAQVYVGLGRSYFCAVDVTGLFVFIWNIIKL